MFSAPNVIPEEIAVLPKVNLHTHLEGSVRPDTFWELCREQKLQLPFERSDVVRALQVTGEERSLVDYLEKIARVYPVLKNAQALYRTAYEAAIDAAHDRVIYLELRAGPMTHACPGLPVEKVIEAMLLGLRRAESETGIVCRLIVAALRNHPVADNLHLAKVAVEFGNEGVVGFDLAGDEANFPAQLHAEAIEIARRGGLGITIHAGEAAGPENVRYAVMELGTKRVGHGIRSVEDTGVMELLAEKGVLLELCPTSNAHTRAVEEIGLHPVRRFFDFGIRIAIGDDDPITSNTRLSRELTLLQEQFGFSIPELQRIQKMALEAAFISDKALRERLYQQICAIDSSKE
ncbi:MAG: adenosine deaminase [Anaerolineales bacterium]